MLRAHSGRPCCLRRAHRHRHGDAHAVGRVAGGGRGRDRRGDRAQRGGQEHAHQRSGGPPALAGGCAHLRGGDLAAVPAHPSRGTGSHSCPKGAGSARMSVERTWIRCCMRRDGRARDPERSPPLPVPGERRRQIAGSLGRPAADGRHRPRADGPPTLALDEPSVSPRRWSTSSSTPSAPSTRRASPSCSWSRTSRWPDLAARAYVLGRAGSWPRECWPPPADPRIQDLPGSGRPRRGELAGRVTASRARAHRAWRPTRRIERGSTVDRALRSVGEGVADGAVRHAP
jgi:hypothetical protein